MSEFVQNMPYTLTVRGRLLELRRPLVMGILNVTPDSFYSASRALEPSEAIMRFKQMVEEGADIIDIGACSTRPGSRPVIMEEERSRLARVLEGVMPLANGYPGVMISIDTFRSEVARYCIEEWGVDIINDITGGEDPEMYSVIAEYGKVYVVMHNRGISAETESSAMYGPDIVADVVSDLAFKVSEAHKAGICNVIVDPGFGFAKTTEQNFALLSRLEDFKVLECPVLVGLSRKRMVREAGECDIADSLVSTVALNAAALLKGAAVIRVHDVKESVKTVKTIGRLL